MCLAALRSFPQLAEVNRCWLLQVQLHADRCETGRQLGSPGLLCLLSSTLALTVQV